VKNGLARVLQAVVRNTVSEDLRDDRCIVTGHPKLPQPTVTAQRSDRC